MRKILVNLFSLPHGVMVAQKILVLLDMVRVRVGQRKKIQTHKLVVTLLLAVYSLLAEFFI